MKDVINGNMITYTALPQLPGEYRHQLILLGKECDLWRIKSERKSAALLTHEFYAEAQKVLNAFEANMRKQFGVRMSRRVYEPVGV